ncbi:glycosyltransferase family 4 protein [Alloiococcus sp. CFN-8]|uniref:glycosyltransferase family 4 protein n=1 Tax=Alloiococcus sp. CFN-8 TaxID=3416081 RepID=UPI003CFAEE65
MNIGIDGRAAYWYRGTGIGTYTYQLLKGLNEIDYLNNYSILSPMDAQDIIAYKPNFNLLKIAKEPKAEFWDSVSTLSASNFKLPELYHVPQNGVGLPLNISSKKIITLHDIIPIRMPETVGEKYLRIFQEEMSSIIESCDGIVTVSNFSKKDISKEFNYPMDKIFVTHLAAEEIYRPINKDYCKKILRETYSIDSPFILYVGGFSPRKNILGLIEAYSKLVAKKGKEIKLVIVGKKGKSFEMYKERAQELALSDSVIFPGFIPLEHMPIFYNCALFLVYPSHYEGFGLPPLEAMACGTPVIASNTTSIPEILEESAVLINPQDIDTLGEAIYSLSEDKKYRSTLIEMGLKRAATFSWYKTATNTLKAYNSI